MSEADDWKTIESWRAVTSHEATLDACGDGGDQWRLTLTNWGPKVERKGSFEGSRAAVVEQGAKWCKADQGLEHSEQVEANLETIERLQAEREAAEAGSDQ